ncbi:MAG: glycosyltransferase family 2 protein [Verrucomicrobiota bacterium]
MKISIITPVFNAAKTLDKTILSVINQDLESELEYIVVDGGSKDGSLDIIEQYRDRISTIISEKDEGVYDAMNKGISHATGDVIGIINADDWYSDSALKTVEKTFQENESAEILYSPVDTYFDGQYLIRFTPGSLENLFLKFTLNHPSCFVRKSVYNRLGYFDLCYSIAADYDFILRAYVSGTNFFYVEDSLASYSLNGLSGKPLAKFDQIKQSWAIGSKYTALVDQPDKTKRTVFYLNWLLKEIIVFPFKHMLDPHTSRKLKKQLRELMGGRLPSDQYGAW